MKLNNEKIRGGAYSYEGNETQIVLAIYEFFKNDFIFFHQHIIEDIEFHQNNGIHLIQVKMNQTKPGQIAADLRKYCKDKNFIDFIIDNIHDIKSWDWVSNTNIDIKKDDIFKLLVPHDVVDDGVVIVDKKTMDDFLSKIKPIFKFHPKSWLSNVEKSNIKLKQIISKHLKFKSKIPFFKEAFLSRTRKIFREQNKNLIDIFAENKTFIDFNELRNIFADYSKETLIKNIWNIKSGKLSKEDLYKRMVSAYGIFKTNIFIKNYNAKYIDEILKELHIEKNELEELYKEIYEN